MKNKVIIVMLILIIIFLSVLIIKITKGRNKSKEIYSSTIVSEDNNGQNIVYSENNIEQSYENNENNIITTENDNKEVQNKNVTSGLSDEEQKDVINEIEKQIKNVNDKVVLIVNGEKITEKEIAIVNFQINNSYSNKSGVERDAKDEVIKEHVIVQNAKEENINLTDKESQDIEKRVSDYMKNDKSGNEKLLNAINMNYDEFLQYYTDRTKKLEIISKWRSTIMQRINNGEMKVDDKTFNDKYNQYKTISEISAKVNLLQELVNAYEEYLKSKSKIEYIN